MTAKSIMPEILTLGVVNLDFVMEAGNEILRNKIMGKKISINAGGHGTSQAIAITRSGVSAAVIGKIGDDAFAGEILSTLRKEAVSCELLQPVKNKNTGLATIIVQDGKENIYLDFLGANYSLSETDIDANREYIKACKMATVHMGVTTLNAAARLFTIAEEYGTPVVAYPSSIPVPKDIYYKKIDYLVTTFADAESLCSFPVTNLKGARLAAALLVNYVRTAVIVQMDGKGVLVATPSGWDIVDVCPDAKIVDHSGMTDFFVGVFAAELVKGKSLNDALRKGHQAAMLCGSKVGVYEAFPTRELIETL